MSKNVGSIDWIICIVVGLVLIAFAVPLGFPSTGWNWVGWIGVAPITTALAGGLPSIQRPGRVATCAVGSQYS